MTTKHKLIIGGSVIVLIGVFGFIALLRARGEYYINGIYVPPMPSAIANNKTIQGIDTNKNGVRDDVERMIAKNFAMEPVKYRAVMEYVRKSEVALVSRSMEDGQKAMDDLSCLDKSLIIRDGPLSQIEKLLLNSKPRVTASAWAFSGTFTGECLRNK